MWEHTKTCLKQGDISLPFPASLKGWEDDIKQWPRVTYSRIFSYFIESVASDGEAMNNLKGSEGYQYLHSNKVGRVLHKAIGDYVYLKADVEPSQRLNVSHHQAWVLVLALTGEIQTAGCSCIAGQGRSCSHAGAILWKVSPCNVRPICLGKLGKCIVFCSFLYLIWTIRVLNKASIHID